MSDIDRDALLALLRENLSVRVHVDTVTRFGPKECLKLEVVLMLGEEEISKDTAEVDLPVAAH